MTPTVLVGRVAAAASLSALAGWSFRPAFDMDSGLAVALAVVLPSIAAAAWELLCSLVFKRLNGATTSMLAVVWVVAVVAAVTRPGRDVLSGPFRLLTGVLPVEASGPQLAAVSLVAGLTALIAVHLAVRSDHVLSPVLPALVCLGIAQSLSAGAGPLPAWYVPVFVVVSVLPALLGNSVAARARLVKGAAVVLLAAVAGSTFVQFGPRSSHPPASAQDLVRAPVQPKQNTNPMAQFLALKEKRLPLEMSGTATAHVDRVGMLTLTDFDGRAWEPAAEYRRSAHQFPSPPIGTAPRRDITLDLRVATPDSVGWLPRSGWPSRIDVADLGFDEQTGDIVVPEGRKTPTEYRITTSEPVAPYDLISTDTPALSQGRTIPLPPDVLAFLDRAIAGHSTDLERFHGLLRTLQSSQFRYDSSDDAPGGNGLYQVSALVRNHRGTSEQYASAFALLCRELGWDARVVLGFKTLWNGDELRITGSDVHAWTEVRFERLGWLPVDPNPALGSDDEPNRSTDPADPPSVEVLPPDEPKPEPVPGAPLGGGTPPATAGEETSTGTVLALAGGVLLLVALTLPVANTVHRRRSLRRGSARNRVLAAWHDTVAVLRAGGADVDERQTTGQVVEAADEQYRPSLLSLAELVDRAAFGPQPVTDATAHTTMDLSNRVRGLVRMSTGRRLLRHFDPRPLLPRRASAEYGRK